LLCENCEEMNKKNKTPEMYEMKYAAVQIITRSSDSGTVEKNLIVLFMRQDIIVVLSNKKSTKLCVIQE